MRAEEDIQAKTRKKRRKKGRKGKNDVKPSRDGGQPSGRDRPQTKAKNHSQRTAPNNGSTQQKRRDAEAEAPRQSSEHEKTHTAIEPSRTADRQQKREAQRQNGEHEKITHKEQHRATPARRQQRKRDTEAEGEHEKTHKDIAEQRRPAKDNFAIFAQND